MSTFTKSVSQILKGALSAFNTFPAAIINAMAFALVTIVRIQLDWPEQEAYNFLFNCLHLTFAFGAVFSLAMVTASQSRFKHKNTFIITNVVVALVLVLIFLALYFLGIASDSFNTSRFDVLSRLAVTRVSAGMVISFLVFIYLAAIPKDQPDISRSLFMTQKALFIAFIYGMVIMAGTSGVAGAIQNLLYNNMTEKIYMYIATLSGFLAFAIFVGYFPDFKKTVEDSRRDLVQKQPQFIEILFQYIMIPIALALTAVLLLWTARTLITGTWPNFIQLSSIATSYAVGGIWLHLMVTHHPSALAKFYRFVYPITALVILAFEGKALLVQVNKFGIKTTEYYFVLVWLVAVTASILLLIFKIKAHTKIVLLICAMTALSVFPIIGYHALPVRSQINRLETILISEGMLKDDQLLPAGSDIALSDKEAITDAVNFLSNAEDAKLPIWFDPELYKSDVFKNQLGFDQTWPKETFGTNASDYMGLYLTAPKDVVNIAAYEWAVIFQDLYQDEKADVEIETNKGIYQLFWTVKTPNGIPSFKITLNDATIVDDDLNLFIDQLLVLHPLGQKDTIEATLDDMSYMIETQDIKVLLIFNNIEINVDPREDQIYYWMNVHAVYLHEK